MRVTWKGVFSHWPKQENVVATVVAMEVATEVETAMATEVETAVAVATETGRSSAFFGCQLERSS